MHHILRKILRCLLFILLITLACAVFGYVVMRLWNWLMPMIFGLRMLTYFQAVGLLVLSKLLLGGFHRHGGGYGGRGRGRWGKHRQWKQHMRERFACMTPEERERFRAGMRGRRGFSPYGPDARPSPEDVRTP